jgi:thiamine pyrophosphate-dependent acetolactate synthase large subunit-like protein
MSDTLTGGQFVARMLKQEGITTAFTLSGLHIAPCPEYAQIIKAFDGYGEKVEDPGEVRKAVERGLRAVAGGQPALIDIRLKTVEQTVERGEG